MGWIISATPLAVSDLVVTNDMLQLSTDLLLDGVCESYKVCFSHCVGIFFFSPHKGDSAASVDQSKMFYVQYLSVK